MFGAGKVLTRVRLISLSRPPVTYKTNQVLQLQAFLPSAFRFSQHTSLPASMNPEISSLLSFWYERSPKDWFMPPEGLDVVCKDRFGDLVHRARTDELDHWADDPKGALALLILLDQFPRNIFRGTPDMCSGDAKALDIAIKSISKGFDKEVTVFQTLTFYLPLMHSESLLAQIAALSFYENLVLRSPEGSDEQQFHKNGIWSAKQHLEVIQKFGRFPSRNKILGRESTKEEEEFLRENPHGFSVPPQPKVS
jgi:uncharacterized protein (DUF924 family)